MVTAASTVISSIVPAFSSSMCHEWWRVLRLYAWQMQVVRSNIQGFGQAALTEMSLRLTEGKQEHCSTCTVTKRSACCHELYMVILHAHEHMPSTAKKVQA